MLAHKTRVNEQPAYIIYLSPVIVPWIIAETSTDGVTSRNKFAFAVYLVRLVKFTRILRLFLSRHMAY